MLLENEIHPIFKNHLLIWLDTNINKFNSDAQRILRQFENVVDEVFIFDDADACIDFLTDVDRCQIFLVIEEELGRSLVPKIHSIPQLIDLYLFGDCFTSEKKWIRRWPKIKNIYNDIWSIRDALQVNVNRLNQDFISISFLDMETDEQTEINPNRFDPRYVFSRLFKDVFLEAEFNQSSRDNFIDYWHQNKSNNARERQVIDEFVRDYDSKKAISWYTRDCFIYPLINRALRSLDGEILMKMSFFICDLHQQIQELYEQQIDQYQDQPLLLYRGQGLSDTEFSKLVKCQGGLMSFNSFISTSKYPDGPSFHAESNAQNLHKYGILFVMTIDPTIKRTSFANISNVSYFHDEEEFLFSMHAVFRIENIEKQERFYQVHLSLASDEDQDLSLLTNHLGENFDSSSAFYKSILLLCTMGEYQIAEDYLAKSLVMTDRSDGEYLSKSLLAWIKQMQGDQKESLRFYAEARRIAREKFPDDHIADLIHCQYITLQYCLSRNFENNNITLDQILDCELILTFNNRYSPIVLYVIRAIIVSQMGNHSQGLMLLQHALQLIQVHHPDVSYLYILIGLEYTMRKEYQNAIDNFYEAMDICQQSSPIDHVFLALYFNMVAFIDEKMNTCTEELLTIENQIENPSNLAPEHYPFYFKIYNDIAALHYRREDYSKAMSFLEKALEICQTIDTGLKDSSLATVYHNAGLAYTKVGHPMKALSYFLQSVECYETFLSPNDSFLAAMYITISNVYSAVEEYSESLSFLQRALEIYQSAKPSDHISLIKTYNNIGRIYHNLGDADQAKSFYHKALSICHKEQSNNPQPLIIINRNLAAILLSELECSNARKHIEKAIEIHLSIVTKDVRSLANDYFMLGWICILLERNFEALSNFQKAQNFMLNDLTKDDLFFGYLYYGISIAYIKTEGNENALAYVERALSIMKKHYPEDHPYIGALLLTINLLNGQTIDEDESNKCMVSAIEMLRNMLPDTHPLLATVQKTLEDF